MKESAIIGQERRSHHPGEAREREKDELEVHMAQVNESM
jgi:hypothetical protein